MLGGQPFGSNLTDLQEYYTQQLQTMQLAQQAQRKTQPLLEEITREVAALSKEEQTVLAQTDEYQMAKQTYEAGFMSYLGNKFGNEYASSPEGKIAAENLLDTIKRNKSKIQTQIKAKEERVNKLLELLETDPEMKKRMDEILLRKVDNNE
jgi:uncharacterized membrane-anchored protein YjiN (DUF445 family)